MENPEPLAGSHVESANVALVVAHALGRHAFSESRADNHCILRHDRCGLDADFTRFQVGENVLVIVEFEIHQSVLSEGRNAHAGLRVQTDEPESRGNVKNSLLSSVGPIREAAARELPRGGAAALSFMLAMNPEQFAGGRVQRNHGAARSSRRVQNAVHHQRCSFKLVLGPVAEIIRLDAPGDFKVVEVRGVDLVQRAVASARKIGGVRRPLRVFRMELSRYGVRPTQACHNNQKPQSLQLIPFLLAHLRSP